MNTISGVLLMAAVIQIAFSAPSTEVIPTTTIFTPVGPMDMDQLVEYYMKNRYHKFDHFVPVAKEIIQSSITKLEDLLKDPETNDLDAGIYQQVKTYFTLYLKDVETEATIKDCSLDKVADFYQKQIRKYIRNHGNKKASEIYQTYMTSQQNATDDNHDNRYLHFFHEHESLYEKVKEQAKFSTKCCMYWRKEYHQEHINGTC